MGLFDTWDEIFNTSISKLDKYDVNRIDEIISIMTGFRNDKFYKELAIIAKEELYASNNTWIFDSNKISKFKTVKKGLGKFNPPFYLPPLTKTVDFNQFLAMYSNIAISYVYSSGHRLAIQESKSILFGDIGERVTYLIEDFEKDEEPPKYDFNFNKRLKNLKFENKKAIKLTDDIYDIDTSISAEFSLPSDFSRAMIHGSIYIMGCNALKNNREVITCEDVVIGYLTTFKIFMSDLRPLIPLKQFIDE